MYTYICKNIYVYIYPTYIYIYIYIYMYIHIIYLHITAPRQTLDFAHIIDSI